MFFNNLFFNFLAIFNFFIVLAKKPIPAETLEISPIQLVQPSFFFFLGTFGKSTYTGLMANTIYFSNTASISTVLTSLDEIVEDCGHVVVTWVHVWYR